jgi:hypothetical protein
MESSPTDTLSPEGTGVSPPNAEGIERELGHDEFDPVGTLTLILGYLAILVLMWVFMYFFEFLGRELTVVG